MRKSISILTVLLLICGITVLSFAQTTSTTSTKKSEVSTEVVRGKITAIDLTKNEIVIKVNKTGLDKTIVVDSTVISTLKADDSVRVTLKAGSNVAEKVKKITKSTGGGKK
jgi:hypothetical protein